jgi:DNA-binding protein
MNKETRIKARNIITIIQSIERKKTNAYVMKNISSRNVHTSSNSIEKRNERRTKVSKIRCVNKSRKD